ncbi:multidrug ABC transporter [Jeotgalicoccus coquinae]|uniref:HAE1 family hydrophobic/amphiphilic exporter-1 n=1 Tax=Jeotgalicoccus coquinae TaxID=709509 RepID=A0A6V7R1X4_9STAP|nr:efflux RND transporter permease subunit [Jeotgalicoccus coquinae]MBB6423602.1 HAE1 family hydrophobic/amphiphilic exporter-1 [Jeotgalicoccus coquinae]GGE21154.1 multidrug ABC transporter [Jeotgalicoccus coquinae]CAD2071336.1 Swarming motility protein SwrC [Jeotgalicoccus coquinae]
MKLSDFSIRRPKFTIVVMIILMLLGIVSLTRLPLQLMPNIQPPIAAVATTYQGAGPEEVMEDVTKPIESELSSINGLSNISSQSQESSSVVILEFGYDMTIDEVESDITRALESVQLPEQAGDPAFLEFDISMMPSIQMAVTSSGENVADYQGQVDGLVTELENIEGVASISQNGTVVEEIQVNLDVDALSEVNMSQSDVAGLIEANNISIPNATIVDTESRTSISTRTVSNIDGVETLRELVIADLPDGGTLTLDDIADVSIEEQDSNSITRLNQDNALSIDVMLASDANASNVNSEFNEVLDEKLDEDEFSNLTVETLYDEGEYIDLAINSVYTSLISGAVLAMIILFAFLRNLKAPLIIGLAIPFSVITTFALLFFTNISINLMTLGGLALGIGMLVDNSVVVIENIYRHLSMGKDPKKAASDGTKEVASAIIASTLTTAAVFAPVVFVSGLVGQLFTPLAITVVFSLFASLFIALTVVPMISSRILNAPKENIEKARSERPYMKLLTKFTRWTLQHRFLVMIITVLLVAAGILGIVNQGMTLMPESDEGALTIEIEKEQGTIYEDTFETVQSIENQLEDYSEVEMYLSNVGSLQPMMSMSEETNKASITATLVSQADRNVTTNEFISNIEDEIEGLDESADINVIPMSQSGISSEPNTLMLRVSDDNAERLAESEAIIIDELEADGSIDGVASSREDMVEEMQIRVDRDAARENGLQPAQIGQALYEASNGVEASTVEANNDYLSINVKYPDTYLDSVSNFETLEIPNAEGEYVQISEVAELEETEMLPLITRNDQEETSELTVTYSSDMSLNEAGTYVEDIVAGADFSEDTHYSVGGDLEMLGDAIPQMLLAIVLGVVFIYLVMVAQFESFRHPFIVIMAMPLSIVGVMAALVLTDSPLSVVSFVGIIMLLGIVVNNSILLVDYTNQQKEKGIPTIEALEISVQHRFRPIIITALTTALGMLPLAMGIGEGGEMVAPMGTVVIGGLVSSTFFTLFVIPIFYSYIDKETRNMHKKYMTPEGEIITQKDIDAKQRQEEQAEQISIDEVNEEEQERNYIDEMQNLIDKLKDHRNKK